MVIAPTFALFLIDQIWMGSFFMAILRSVLEMNCGEIMLQCINVYINLKFIIAHQHSFLFKLMDMICYKSLSLFT